MLSHICSLWDHQASLGWPHSLRTKRWDSERLGSQTRSYQQSWEKDSDIIAPYPPCPVTLSCRPQGIQFQKKFLFSQIVSFFLGSHSENDTTTRSSKLKIFLDISNFLIIEPFLTRLRAVPSLYPVLLPSSSLTRTLVSTGLFAWSLGTSPNPSTHYPAIHVSV